MRLLAMDQAPRNIGIAFCHTEDGLPYEIGAREFDSFGENDRLLQRAVRAWLDPIIDRIRPDVIVFEQIVVNLKRPNLRTLYQQFSVVAAIDTVADAYDIDTYQVDVPVWRKHFIGTAGAPRALKSGERADWLKTKAIERCKELGWQIPNHHAAEACGIWDYAAWKLDAAYKSASRKAENVRQAA